MNYHHIWAFFPDNSEGIWKGCAFRNDLIIEFNRAILIKAKIFLFFWINLIHWQNNSLHQGKQEGENE